MGIRVHKDIGYYLPKKHISKLLVKDYDDVIDDNYTLTPDLIERVIARVEQLGKEYPQVDVVFAIVQLKDLCKEKHICADNFVSIIHCYDTFKGVLFRTPNLKSYCRFDDLIDYYEEVKNAKFKVKYLKQAIYPNNFYVCLDVPPVSDVSSLRFTNRHYSHAPLAPGHMLMSDEMRMLMLENGVKCEFDKPNGWVYPEKGHAKYFHPYVDVMTYAFAQEIGLLKDGVSYLDFIQCLEPAMLTHWG